MRHTTMAFRAALFWTLMLMAALSGGRASAQNQNSPTINGIVVGSAADKSSFSIVDRSGAAITLNVSGNTSYQSNRVEVKAAEVIRFGMEIRATAAPDGSVAQVTARGITSQLNVVQLQPFLGATDAEWAVLKPKIEKVQALRRIAESRATNSNDGNNNGNNNGNGNNPPPPKNPVQDLQRDLNSAFFDRAAAIPQLMNTLAQLRQTQARSRDELELARRNLAELTTTRQEVLLVIMGILE